MQGRQQWREVGGFTTNDPLENDGQVVCPIGAPQDNMPMPDQSFTTPMTNQTQIPYGDDDDDIEEYPDPDEELIETHNPSNGHLLQQSEKSNKFLALYEDAQ